MALTQQRFALRWSSSAWAISVGVSAIALCVPIVVLLATNDASRASGALGVLLVAAAFSPVAVLAVLVFFAPLAFEVRPDAVVVKRVGRDVSIPRGEIHEVRRIEPGEARLVWRLCGSGGFLGFFGLFYSSRSGKFWVYAGNRQDLVLLALADGTKIVISPYRPDEFIKAVQLESNR